MTVSQNSYFCPFLHAVTPKITPENDCFGDWMANYKFPFSLFKRKSSRYYYVKFKDEKTGVYSAAVSTKETDRTHAMKKALLWYSNGKVKAEEEEKSLALLTAFESLQAENLTKSDTQKILSILKNKGLIKTFVLPNEKDDIDFCKYLSDFWDWNKSDYVQEKLKSDSSIGKKHAEDNMSRIKNYWLPKFEGRLLGELTKKDMRDFSLELSRLPLTSSTKNKIWLAGEIAVKHAFKNELILTDITAGLTGFHGKAKEREILTPEIVQALFSVEWKDERAKLANQLAMCTGLRLGEIRALRKCDLGKKCLYINHSWSEAEGLKSPKNGEARTVQLPFPEIAYKLLKLAESNPFDSSMNAFVFYATVPGQPVEAHTFLDALRKSLSEIGMENAENYTFHAWRHFFATYMGGKVDAKLLQMQTGHKTRAMLEHYQDHKTNSDYERIREAQIKAFGEIMNFS